jgi:RHH-type proline utilization regulon transcriptional repressor/proline dehydrogenase/delta 1-pyrroline-5-carboxylate dehydrogenase
MVLSRFLPALSAATRRPEAECVRALLPQARLSATAAAAARATAERLIVELRARRSKAGGVTR